MESSNVFTNIHSVNLYQHLPVPTYVWKASEGEIFLLDYNQAALKFSGTKLDHLIGLSANAIYSDMPHVVKLMTKCCNLKQPVVQELEMKLRTIGEPKLLKCTWVWIDPDIILFIPEDLTEIKKIRTSLELLVARRTKELQVINDQFKKEQHRLSAIIEGTNVGTWEWNIQTGETAFNERWAATIGYSLAELGPSNTDTWVKYTHPKDLKTSISILQKHFRKELDYYEYEGRLRHKNGSWVWVHVRGKVAEWSNDGKPLTMFGSHQDITERKNAELELKKMYLALEQKIQKRTSELAMSNMLMQQEIKDRKKSQEALQKSEISLEQERASLQEANITLRVLMKELEQERKSFEEKVLANLIGLVDPYLNKLKQTSLDGRQVNYVEIVEANLKNIVSPFIRTSVAIDLKLTPTETQIASLIRDNKSSKQIAASLSLSPLTIAKHRGNIRKKLGILNQKINLKTLLNSQ